MTQRYDGERHDERSPYEAPRLTPLGSLSDLTLGPLGNNEDGLTGNLDSEILP